MKAKQMTTTRRLAAIGIMAVTCAATGPPAAGKLPTPSPPNAPYGDLGTPPSGKIPILFNDRHVYARPDRLTRGRLMVALARGNVVLGPLRTMLDQMGTIVSYDPITQTIDVSKPGSSVKMSVGRAEVVINDVRRPLDVPPEMYEGALLVPLRVLCENIGAYVVWVPRSRVAVVRMFTDPVPQPLATPAPAASP
jgi:hypothetical protein